MGRGDYRSAVRLFQRVAGQDPELFGEVLPQLAECYQRLGQRKDLFAFLEGLLAERPDTAVLLALTDLVQEDSGDAQALRYVAEHLGPRPSLAGLLRMIRLAENSPQATAPELLPILRTVAERLVEGRHAYQCGKCGFAAKTLHWQCPGCRSWSSIKPVRDRDG
jgi:lipopolysaccharide biosynthesis regulator YciM